MIWNKEKNEDGSCFPVLKESVERRVENRATESEGEVRATVLIRSTPANVMTLPVPSHFLSNLENFIRRKLE